MALVLTEFQEMVGTLTLNHNEKRNALSAALIDELETGLKELRHKGARAVILRALRGATVFSAGHHVAEMPRSGRDPLAYSDPLEHGIRAIRHFPAPVIAMIEGSVWGGAVELTLCCDLRIAAPTATFALTPVKLGVPYNPAGILRIMNALAPQLVNEMFFTAAPIDAARALAAGMVNHVVETERIEAFTLEMALRITEFSPRSISVIKEQLRILRNAAPLSPETFERIQGLRRSVYDSQDYKEGRDAFLEKRKPVFTGE